MKLIAEYILAYNEKKTPYHWIQIQDMDATNSGVFVLRAWGKKPSQVKSMAFKGRSQCSSYHEKWKQDRQVEKTERLGEFGTAEELTHFLEHSFPWLDMHEHTETLEDVIGVTIPTHKPVVSKPQIPVQQLPETYGWW